MRHTKIIATVGPASDSDAMLESLIAGGTDVFRLNFSHGTQES
ncbi:MAG: pyruvate kinase, partial [Acidobacteria bacterium]|nr:pyruvate kinase [Acidobacteriota bacterium]